MASFDVVSLFTNILLQETIDLGIENVFDNIKYFMIYPRILFMNC